MTGTSLITACPIALKIFVNPGDIGLLIKKYKDKGKEKGKYVFFISQGLGYNFKILKNTIPLPYANTHEEAVRIIKEFLESAKKHASEELMNESSDIAQAVKSLKIIIDPLTTLSQQMIDQVIVELSKKEELGIWKKIA
jgi:hypothetical protein